MSVVSRIKQLGGETLIYGISGTISRSIGIFLVPLYTRVFSPTDYGIIAIINAFVGLLTIFIVLGMDNSSARWFYETDDTIQRKQVIGSWFWVQLSVGTIVALTISLLAPQIANLLLGSKEFALLVLLSACTIPLSTFGKVLGNWLRYQRRAWMTTIYNLASALGVIVVIFLFVLVWRWGLVGLYSARLVAATLTGLVAAFILKSWIAPQHVSWKLLKDMLVFGLPLMPAGIASWITISSDRFILKMFVETSEIGIYAIAAACASGVALVTGAFQMSWGPFAYSILNEENSRYIYSKVLSVYSWLGCLLATAVSLFAPLLLYVLTTPQYYPAASSVSYLAFSHLALGATYIAAIGSGIAKKSTPIAYSIFIGAGINIALNFTLIPYLGREGAAIATLLAYLFATVYLFFASQKIYYIPYQFKDVFTCFGFSWILIGINQFFIPTWGLAAFGIRVGLCLLFIPLAFLLGLVKFENIKPKSGGAQCP